MEQTAVEWLLEEIEKNTGLNYLYEEDYVIKAKELEKQQIIAACESGEKRDFLVKYEDFEDYYNETFKK